MQEILAEIWPPLIMVLFGTVSVVAAILGKAICSLDQNSFFFGTILLPYNFFLQKENVLIVYRECLNFLVNKMNSPNRYYWWISWRIVKQLLENSDQKCWWLCLIAFKFPETANDKLPETIHDALQLGQNVKRNKFGVITSVWWSPENTKILFMYL